MSWGALGALTASFTWALAVSQYSILLKRYPAMTVNWNRAAFALPCFMIASSFTMGGWLSYWRLLGSLEPIRYVWLTLSIVGSFAFGDALFLWSVRSLGAPLALAISSIYPVWSGLAAFLFQGEMLGPTQWGRLVVVFFGVAWVVMEGSGQERETSARRRYFLGVGCAFAASFFWSLNTYAIARGSAGVSAFVASSIRMGMAMVLAPLIASLTTRKKEPLRFFLEGRDVRRFFWVFWVESFLGSAAFMYGLTHTELAISSSLSSLAPVISVPMAWARGSSKMTLRQGLGIAVVVLGIVMLVGGK